MIRSLAKFGLGALLLSTLASVQGPSFKYEVLPSDLNNGIICEIWGVNFVGLTGVEFEPQIGLGGFSFGTSGVMIVRFGSQAVFSFSSFLVDHYAYPRIPQGATWDSWVLSPVGSNDAGYFSWRP